MKQVRWGMIGHGSVAEIKSGPGLYKADRSSLRGVYGRNTDKAKDYAARHGVGIVYDSVDAVLADPEIDAVYLPVPPKFHHEYALRCVEAGKIPYIEKPMAMSFAECSEIIDKATEKGLPAYVAFYRRGLEKFHKIKAILESGEIGQIRYVEVKQVMPPESSDHDPNHLPWRLIPDIAGGGKFLDMAVHVLDILDFFFGKIVEAKGIATNRGGLYKVEDTVCASFQFANGIIGSGLWCYVADHAEDYVRIVGDRGSIVFEGMGYGPATVQVGETRTVHAFVAPQHIGLPYIQTIVDELVGRGKSPADLQSAANVIRVTDLILGDYRLRYGTAQ